MFRFKVCPSHSHGRHKGCAQSETSSQNAVRHLLNGLKSCRNRSSSFQAHAPHYNALYLTIAWPGHQIPMGGLLITLQNIVSHQPQNSTQMHKSKMQMLRPTWTWCTVLGAKKLEKWFTGKQYGRKVKWGIFLFSVLRICQRGHSSLIWNEGAELHSTLCHHSSFGTLLMFRCHST